MKWLEWSQVVQVLNVYDKKLIQGEQIGEGPGGKDEVWEVDEVLRVLRRHDPAHAARLPADVTEM